MSDRSRPAPTARRAFLRLVALAPVAAAGCATVKPLAAAPAAAAASSGPAPAPDPAGDALAPLRSFPLALEVEPAFVFRASVPPGGE